MGRGKIEIKRIENLSNRQVTYSKRRNGIIKKAREISVLCDAQVSLIIFASSGKMHEFCSPSTTLIELLDRYHGQSGKNKLWDAKHENLSNEIERVKKENDSMQIKLRHLKGEDLPPTIQELIELEDALETGLANISDQQSELAKMVRRNVKMAEDENRELTYKSRKMAMEGDFKEMHYDAGTSRGYDELPFAFRVQPMQPNLQERMHNIQL